MSERRGVDQIADMAAAMANEMAANAHKGGYEDLDPEVAAHETLYHSMKLFLAMAADGDHREAVLEYAADVANSAMFCALSKDALDLDLLTPGHAEDGDAPWRFKLPMWKRRCRGIVGEVMGTKPQARVSTFRAGVAGVRRFVRRALA